MPAAKGSVPWNAGTSTGWTDKRGYMREELKAERALSANLLEALTDCVEHMHWTQPQGEAALKKAKAVIAKATGGDA